MLLLYYPRENQLAKLNAPCIFCKFTLDISKVMWYDYKRMFAGVVELVDTRDLKSLGSDAVPVRARPPAPLRFRHYLLFKYRGVEQLAARRAHNPEVAGSSPAAATKKRLISHEISRFSC